MKVLRGLERPTESQTQAALHDAGVAGEEACNRVRRRFKRIRQQWSAQVGPPKYQVTAGVLTDLI